MKPDPLRDLHAVLAQVHEALEARGIERARTLTLLELSQSERRSLANLCGWREVPRAPRVRVSLAELDKALRESAVGVGVAELVARLFGPIADRRTERAGAIAARDALWSRARESVEHRPELLPWLDDLRRHGRVARAATLSGTSEDVMLERTLAVVGRLPATGFLLPVFALETLGDSHALDAGEPLSSLVLRAAAALRSSPPPTNAVERRRLWADVGVACDSLSADVLSLGLRPVGEGLLARHLREASEAGHPRRTTLRELQREQIALRPGTVVSVCENPSVVAAAADRLGDRVRPLVCVEGVPSTAALRLLAGLLESGATVQFHTDFDWGGLRIGNVLLDHLQTAQPWRMGASDYEQAVERNHGISELAGTPVDASWNPTLSSLLARSGVAVLEEAMIDELLEDLEWT
ncbi:MAG: TIGR02679 family protein [Archangium sp.]|nr:TIGR02679 family protein [Archangium sp.]